MLTGRRTREPMQALIIELGETGTSSKVVLNGVKPKVARCVITIDPMRRPVVELTLAPTMDEHQRAPVPARRLRGELVLPPRQPVMIVGQYTAVATAESPDDWPSSVDQPQTTVGAKGRERQHRRDRRWRWWHALVGASC